MFVSRREVLLDEIHRPSSIQKDFELEPLCKLYSNEVVSAWELSDFHLASLRTTDSAGVESRVVDLCLIPSEQWL